MSKRVYSEEEMVAILRRVAELQHHRDTKKNKSGLTLDELESVARESGLDPTLLRQAASEIDLSGTTGSSASEKTKTHIYHERTFPYRVSDDAWAEFVFELNDRFRSDVSTIMGVPTNRVQEIGDSYEWKHTSLSGIETRITLRRRANHTNLKLSQRLGMSSSEVESVGLGFFFGLIVSVITAAATSSVLTGVVVLLLMMMVLTPSIYIADTKWREKKNRNLEALTEDADRIFSSFAAEDRSASAMEPEPEAEASRDSVETPDLLKDSDAYTGASKRSDAERRRTR